MTVDKAGNKGMTLNKNTGFTETLFDYVSFSGIYLDGLLVEMDLSREIQGMSHKEVDASSKRQ